jgi:pentapeptide MXKDX repeat protein
MPVAIGRGNAAFAPGSAQDKPGTMGKDTMSKGGETMARDKIGKAGMKKDDMTDERKKEPVKKDEMKK